MSVGVCRSRLKFEPIQSSLLAPLPTVLQPAWLSFKLEGTVQTVFSEAQGLVTNRQRS